MRCRARPLTPLEEYSKSCKDQAAVDTEPMLFPMFTVLLDSVMSMTKVEPHEVLKSKGRAPEVRMINNTRVFPRPVLSPNT